MSRRSDDSTLLPEGFVPSDKDVICSWARQNHEHAGNKRFRELISQFSPQYMKATTKLAKTEVIAAVIEQIRNESPGGGGFVKKDFYSGRWYEIGDEKARDKVGHAMRKAAELCHKEQSGEGSGPKATASKSSTAIKKTKKKEKSKERSKRREKSTKNDAKGGEEPRGKSAPTAARSIDEPSNEGLSSRTGQHGRNNDNNIEMGSSHRIGIETSPRLDRESNEPQSQLPARDRGGRLTAESSFDLSNSLPNNRLLPAIRLDNRGEIGSPYIANSLLPALNEPRTNNMTSLEQTMTGETGIGLAASTSALEDRIRLDLLLNQQQQQPLLSQGASPFLSNSLLYGGGFQQPSTIGLPFTGPRVLPEPNPSISGLATNTIPSYLGLHPYGRIDPMANINSIFNAQSNVSNAPRTNTTETQTSLSDVLSSLAPDGQRSRNNARNLG